jgi:hypothetical protein
MVILGDTERRCRHDLGDDGLGKARRDRAERRLGAAFCGGVRGRMPLRY